MTRVDPFTATETFVPAGSEFRDDFGVITEEFFVGDGYARLCRMPQGAAITEPRHKVNYSGALLIGRVILEVNGYRIELNAPWVGTLLAASEYRVVAADRSLWSFMWERLDGTQ